MKHRSPFILSLSLLLAVHSTTAQAEIVFIGDAASEGDAVTAGGNVGPDGAGSPVPGAITYGFYEIGYTNTSGAAEELAITGVNFWSRNAGVTLTPWVAVYNGGPDPANAALGANFNVLAQGDGISSVPDLNNAEFLVDGQNPVLTLNDGDTLIGGFHQDGQAVVWTNGVGVGDYLASGQVLPADVGALSADANWSNFDHEYRFNIAIDTDVIEPTDTDEDGLPDEWEEEHDLNPDDPDDAADDPDGDTLTNLEEFDFRTDPNDADTDGDMLDDNVKLEGAGSRPPTDPLEPDTDGDDLSDLVETNTGTYVSETDTGSDPTDTDSDDDSLGDADEVNGDIFSNPNLADTDGDGAGDVLELRLGHDPNDPTDFPRTIYIGDAAGEGANVTVGGNVGPDGAGNPAPGAITYAFYETGYTNETAAAQVFQISQVNFWGRNAGITLTPFVALYNEVPDPGSGAAAANYNVVSRGDLITSEIDLNNAEFLVGGEIPEVTLESGDTLIAGFHQDGQIVPWTDGVGVGDYLGNGLTIPDVPPGGAFGADATWSNLAREYRFNIGLEPGSSQPFAITSIVYDEANSSAAITFPSRAGRIFAIDASGDLANWFELDDGIVGGDGETTFTETPLPPDARRRFYRVRAVDE